MNDDADWVEDVRRWYFAGAKANVAEAAADSAGVDGEDSACTDFALGYEAAQPMLQARHWPDVPVDGFERSVY